MWQDAGQCFSIGPCRVHDPALGTHVIRVLRLSLPDDGSQKNTVPLSLAVKTYNLTRCYPCGTFAPSFPSPRFRETCCVIRRFAYAGLPNLSCDDRAAMQKASLRNILPSRLRYHWNVLSSSRSFGSTALSSYCFHDTCILAATLAPLLVAAVLTHAYNVVLLANGEKCSFSLMRIRPRSLSYGYKADDGKKWHAQAGRRVSMANLDHVRPTIRHFDTFSRNRDRRFMPHYQPEGFYAREQDRWWRFLRRGRKHIDIVGITSTTPPATS